MRYQKMHVGRGRETIILQVMALQQIIMPVASAMFCLPHGVTVFMLMYSLVCNAINSCATLLSAAKSEILLQRNISTKFV